MSTRSVKIVTVVGLVTGLIASAGATAWADAFTPAIEEPVFQLGLLRGTPLGGSTPDGNSSSAQSGRSYQYGYSDDGQSSGTPDDDAAADRYGYWRTGEDDGS